MKRGWLRRPAVVIAILAVAWAVAALLLVPELIRAAHAGRLGILASLMEGRDSAAVDRYLAKWSSVAKSLTFIFVTGLLALGVWKRLSARGRQSELPSPPRKVSFLEILALALWFGLATGAAEAYYVLGKVLILHELVPDFRPAGQHTLWMAPVGNAAVFVFVGCLLAPVLLLVERWSRKPGTAGRLLTGVFSFFAILALLMLPDRIQLWAAATLATGLAVAVVRSGVLAHYLHSPARSRKLLSLAAVPLGLYLIVAGGEYLRERRGVARLPDAIPGAPNVLLLVLDTQRAQSMGLYGYSRPTTPRLQDVATQAVVFDRAIASAPWTLPSHATMFTGRYNIELATGWFHGLDDKFLTLAEVLRDHGYRTGGFVANTGFCNDWYGLHQGFLHYRDEATGPGGILDATWLGRSLGGRIQSGFGDHSRMGRRRADLINREFLDWVDGIPGGRPFFAFLNYFDSHAPYRAPAPFGLRYAGKNSQYWFEGEQASVYSAEALRGLSDNYDGATAYVDSQVSLLMDALRQRGRLDNTVLVIVADHGESFGEHSWVGHGQSVYLPAIWVPLLIRYPGRVPGGLRIQAPVSPRDIPATVMDLVGIAQSAAFPGASLARHWKDGSAGVPADTILSEFGLAQSLVVGRYHLVSRGNGRMELFDIESDGAEANDLAETMKDNLRALRAALETMTSPPNPRRN